ncbi:hypothetical protein [Myxococcus sp. RHSTA-1-4]|uniref:hypothetical protein n=1 Tax=Myxococcus sp. RHSTA-1-4 TaxID=2874601 RepID=UPI001CBAFDD6|nr:hypothetical protein [Myxococcus sp. RHSTA-1-4]MBZ4421562.1 hypothetical protein [Myxococcus sp. RHSTA-1-4]
MPASRAVSTSEPGGSALAELVFAPLEAHVFLRYLLGAEPPAEVVERYRAANEKLFAEPASAADARLLDYVTRRPWALPMLDAAAAFRRPDSLLRRKLLVGAAVLEATPDFTARFLPQAVSVPRLVLRGALLGLSVAFKLVVGLILLSMVEAGGDER